MQSPLPVWQFPSISIFLLFYTNSFVSEKLDLEMLFNLPPDAQNSIPVDAFSTQDWSHIQFPFAFEESVWGLFLACAWVMANRAMRYTWSDFFCYSKISRPRISTHGHQSSFSLQHPWEDRKIHTFTSNILFEQRRFCLGCPSLYYFWLDKGWGNPDRNVVAQTICCWWTCGFAWWLWFPSENHHWKAEKV